MRTIGYLMLGLMLTGMSHAQGAPDASSKRLTPDQYRFISEFMYFWEKQRPRYTQIRLRAEELRPSRRNSPLRELNITDDEVREVVGIAADYLPRDLVNISPVVTACPCEEGPTCTAQVFVLATSGDETTGLQLSRMNKAWQVGVVQRWWLKRNAVTAQKTGNATLDGFLYDKALHELYDEFPVCLGPGVPPSQFVSLATEENK